MLKWLKLFLILNQVINQKICERVLNNLKTGVFSIELFVIELKISKKLQISTLNLIACKEINTTQHYDKVKNCLWIASDIGANTELLMDIMRDVIFKSNVLRPILKFKCTIGLVRFGRFWCLWALIRSLCADLNHFNSIKFWN